EICRVFILKTCNLPIPASRFFSLQLDSEPSSPILSSQLAPLIHPPSIVSSSSLPGAWRPTTPRLPKWETTHHILRYVLLAKSLGVLASTHYPPQYDPPLSSYPRVPRALT